MLMAQAAGDLGFLSAIAPQLTGGGALVVALAAIALRAYTIRVRAKSADLKTVTEAKDAGRLREMVEREHLPIDIGELEKTPAMVFELAKIYLKQREERARIAAAIATLLIVLMFVLATIAIWLHFKAPDDPYEGWCVTVSASAPREGTTPCPGGGQEAAASLRAPVQRHESFRLRTTEGLHLLSEECESEANMLTSCDFESEEADFVVVGCESDPSAAVFRLALGSSLEQRVPRCP